jgi:hypothetical protein
MKTSRTRAAWLGTALAAALGAVACGDDAPTPVVPGPDGSTIPAAWAGVWRFTTVEIDCLTGDTLATFVAVDTVCAGARIESEFEDLQQLPLFCPTAVPVITDSTLRIDCSQTGHDDPTGCDFLVQVTGTVTLHAVQDSLDGAFRLQVTPSPPTCEGALCNELSIQGTRLDRNTPNCPPAAVNLSAR